MDSMLTAVSFSLLLSVLPQASSSRTPARTTPVLRQIAACEAVTRTDVETALGRAIAGGKEQSAYAETSCDYIGEVGQVTITFHRSSKKLNLAAEIENLTAAIPDGQIRDVTGLGTKAFFMDMGDSGTQLHVVRGEHDYLLISVLGFGSAAEVSTAAERIARKALSRL